MLGVILGDGSLSKGRCGNGTGYGLRLEVKSEAFARKFASHVEAVVGRKPWFTTYTKTVKANPKIRMPEVTITCHITGIWSREWYDILAVFEKQRQFSGILEFGEEFKRGFLQGMIDSEGYVNPKYVDVANKDIQLLETVKLVAESLGHRAYVTGPYPYSRGVAHLRLDPIFQKTA